MNTLDRAVAQESPWACEFRIHRQGETRWLWGQSIPHKRDNGALVFDGIILDTTERRRAEDEVRYLKQYDSLTGLPNRFLVKDRLKAAIESADTREKVGVVHLSVDQFASIADTLGHNTVEELVRQFVQRLADGLEERQTLGRVGDNDFVVLLPEQESLDDITGVVARLRAPLQAAIRLADHDIHVTTSIGIAVSPDDGSTADELLRDSSAARDRVANEGGDGYQFFTREMTKHAIRRLSLDGRLRKALEHEQFELFFQPILGAHGGRVVAAEALIRWHTPEGERVSPGEFIPLLEETGLIVGVGEWVLHEACRRAAQLQKAGHRSLRIHVNISARQLSRADVLKQMNEAVTGAGIDLGSIELELTESALMESIGTPFTFLESAHDLGVRIAIDDFGTGYSSLGYLKDFPVDTLKIDQSFIAVMTNDAKSASLVNAIITMARGFDMRVVAEGVENEQQLTYMRAYNCDYVQGFHFHKPMPFEEFLKILNKDP